MDCDPGALGSERDRHGPANPTASPRDEYRSPCNTQARLRHRGVNKTVRPVSSFQRRLASSSSECRREEGGEPTRPRTYLETCCRRCRCPGAVSVLKVAQPYLFVWGRIVVLPFLDLFDLLQQFCSFSPTCASLAGGRGRATV